MSDISARTTTFGNNEDRSWLASSHGTEATRSGTLDVSTLTSGTHFASGGGIVASGTAVGRNASSGLWEPFSHVDGNFDAVGLLFTSTYVASTSDSDKAIAILEHGFVVEASLPSNNGVTAEFKTAAPLIHFR